MYLTYEDVYFALLRKRERERKVKKKQLALLKRRKKEENKIISTVCDIIYAINLLFELIFNSGDVKLRNEACLYFLEMFLSKILHHSIIVVHWSQIKIVFDKTVQQKFS